MNTLRDYKFYDYKKFSEVSLFKELIIFNKASTKAPVDVVYCKVGTQP